MNPRSTITNLSATKYSRSRAALCTMALAAATMFVGCMKPYLPTDEVTPDTNHHPYNPAPIPNTAVLEYHLETVTPAPDALIQWNAGYLTSNTIGFDGVRHLGSALALAAFSNATNHSTALFAPGVIGSVTVSHSLYQPMDFKVGLNPILKSDAVSVSGYYLSPISATSDPAAVEKLAGMQKVPVKFIVQVPVDIKVTQTDPFLINKDKYISLLSFVPSTLNDGIDLEMLDHATRIDGVVVISAAVNPTIYNTMLHNLNNALQVNFQATALADNK